MRNRTIAALGALSTNALLLSALMLFGRAEAEPSAQQISNPARSDEAISGSAKPATKQTTEQTAEAPKAKPKKSLARKMLPVKDFGGY